MRFIPLGLFAALLAALDQISKYFVVKHIEYGAVIPCIEGLFHLTYVQNFGAAFSILQGHKWLFVLVFVVFLAMIVWGIRKELLPFARAELWFLAAIVGGGLGNILDRLFRGFVVDMIAVDFIDFPVFNLADCFITCGAIGLLFHLVFLNKGFWKDEKKTLKADSRKKNDEPTTAEPANEVEN
ncbi:MAG: signal peptidase II [Ruminococcaceae bacterium]|nr:signal peptidase II [Oscillospiraceae bacterium]